MDSRQEYRVFYAKIHAKWNSKVHLCLSEASFCADRDNRQQSPCFRSIFYRECNPYHGENLSAAHSFEISRVLAVNETQNFKCHWLRDCLSCISRFSFTRFWPFEHAFLQKWQLQNAHCVTGARLCKQIVSSRNISSNNSFLTSLRLNRTSPTSLTFLDTRDWVILYTHLWTEPPIIYRRVAIWENLWISACIYTRC